MKHLQKLVPIVLAFVLALSLSLTALAEEDYGQEVTGEGNLFQNNEAKTTFSVVCSTGKSFCNSSSQCHFCSQTQW